MLCLYFCFSLFMKYFCLIIIWAFWLSVSYRVDIKWFCSQNWHCYPSALRVNWIISWMLTCISFKFIFFVHFNTGFLHLLNIYLLYFKFLCILLGKKKEKGTLTRWMFSYDNCMCSPALSLTRAHFWSVQLLWWFYIPWSCVWLKLHSLLG